MNCEDPSSRDLVPEVLLVLPLLVLYSFVSAGEIATAVKWGILSQLCATALSH